MRVLILATQWGAEDIPFEDFLIKIKNAGYDGVDTWVPEGASERRSFVNLLESYDLPLVCHQHRAKGDNISSFCRSFEYELNLAMESGPFLINSHSGRDYFSFDDQLRIIDVAQNFADRHDICIAHETHRGRMGYSPYNFRDLFNQRPQMRITADLSHWVCVTESYLENCIDTLHLAMANTEHIHARIGHTQATQVTDPSAAQWQAVTDIYLTWWLRILEEKASRGHSVFTITPEFGPPPYMPFHPQTGNPLADQFSVNNYIKDVLRHKTAAL